MKEKSIYSVGRTEHGFGMLVEGDDTYVTGEHDAEKSDLSDLMNFCKRMYKQHEQTFAINGENGLNFVSSFGKEGHVLVMFVGQTEVDGKKDVGFSMIQCDRNGQNERYTFSKDEASDISKITELLKFRVENYVRALEKTRQTDKITKVSLSKIDERLPELNRNLLGLNMKLNVAKRAEEINKALVSPKITYGREQVALAR